MNKILIILFIIIIINIFICVYFNFYSKDNYINTELPSKYIWSKGFNLIADRGLNTNEHYPPFNPENFKDLKNRNVVCIRTDHLKTFIEEVFVKLKSNISIILITGDSDWTVPNDIWYLDEENDPFRTMKNSISEPNINFKDFLNDPRLKHWFAQNLNHYHSSKKLSGIPIGNHYHDMREHSVISIEEKLDKYIKELPKLKDRPLKVYSNFQLNNTSSRFKGVYNEDRQDIYNILKDNPNIYFEEQNSGIFNFWAKMGDYSFSVSPIGNGLDCHRTWELLFLNVIPIMKSNVLDPLFKDLPVVIVKEWNEINEENLKIWKENIIKRETSFNRSKLFTQYWVKKIKQLK